MIEIDPPVGVGGLLGEFATMGVLTWGDVHPARLFGRLFGEADDRVLLAAAFAVRGRRRGSVCIDLAELPHEPLTEGDTELEVPAEAWPDPDAWVAALEASPCVSVGPDAPGVRPLRWVDGLLYLERAWADQEVVAAGLRERLTVPVAVDPTLAPQERARALARTAPVSIVAGGPGTGKTTIIERLLADIRADDPDALIALAAPTGKAAARMSETLEGDTATTLHRLLGPLYGTMMRFKHDRHNPLPHDLVIVDEVSMVSLPLMARLIEALRPQARLVLVGDPHQLASVEEGSVLADLTHAATLAPVVTRLTQRFRFDGAIAELADAITPGQGKAERDPDAAAKVIGRGTDAVRLLSASEVDALRERVVSHGVALAEAAASGDEERALRLLDAHRLLCAHRDGPYGVSTWIERVHAWLAAAGVDTADPFGVGRPVMVTTNLTDLGVFNGDTGVIMPEPGGGVRALFDTPSGRRRISPWLLEGLVSADALTIHKSQGSQFDRVSVILPPESSPLLTRELLYTAVTRAKQSVWMVGALESVTAAIERPTRRTSGLGRRLDA